MARYREKSEDDLRWNKIRRRLTRELDMQVADAREDMLNTLLSGAWVKYNEALDSGEKLQIEDEHTEWVARALSQAINTEKILALEP